jgi:hypothetical protein
MGADSNIQAKKSSSMKALLAAHPEKMRGRLRILKASQADPIVEERRRAAIRSTLAQPDVKARQSEGIKKALARADVKARQSRGIKKALARPDVKSRMIAGIKKAAADPEVQGRKRASMKARIEADPEERARLTTRLQKLRSDPRFERKRIAGIKKALARPDVKEKQSSARKKFWAEVSLAKAAQKKNKPGPPGRPRIEVYNEATRLHLLGWGPGRIARQLDPNYAGLSEQKRTIREHLRNGGLPNGERRGLQEALDGIAAQLLKIETKFRKPIARRLRPKGKRTT